MVARKLILFELNEVPWRILDDYAEQAPGSALAHILRRSHCYEAYSEDTGHLSPWITWPSLHRGVSNDLHRIADLGQDRAKADRLYPPIWQLLHAGGVSVGVGGSLHSAPAPADMSSYAFYLPDAFATRDEAHPPAVTAFQSLSLSMTRKSGRNVDTSLPVRSAARVLAGSRALGIRPVTYGAVAAHLAGERRQRWRSTRRRTFQAVLGFDIYFAQLKRTMPQFSTFFTNHVASAMHRYWAATYPGDYDVYGLDAEWIDRYRGEIPWAMRQAEKMLERLVWFADRNPEYQVWVASSMGQGPTTARSLESAVYLKDLPTFMRRLGVPDEAWEARPAMLPQTNVMVREDLSDEFETKLSGLTLDDRAIPYRKTEGGFFAMNFGQHNLHSRPAPVHYEGERRQLAEFGMQAVEIEDKSHTTAHHVPEGTLFVYDPKIAEATPERTRVSALTWPLRCCVSSHRSPLTT